MIIEIDGIPIEITRKFIKSLRLRIYPPDGLVKVSAPMKYSEQLIRMHLQEKSAWIHAQRERIRARPIPKNSLLQTGSTVDFMGKSYLLLVTEHHGQSQIKIDRELIHCYTTPNASEAQNQILLERWYRHEMASLLPELLQHWEAVIGVKTVAWGIKKMKTRWGSCNTHAQRIWLNLSLIKKPLLCLEYVLVHELVHLLEASHNQRFYSLMTQFMPNWRDHQYLLEGKRCMNDRIKKQHAI